jgi:hypothetical protein
MPPPITPPKQSEILSGGTGQDGYFGSNNATSSGCANSLVLHVAMELLAAQKNDMRMSIHPHINPSIRIF